MAATPDGPSAHGIVAPGKAAKNLATAATAAAHPPATATGTTASPGANAASGTAIVPTMVTGATKGPATTLAMSAKGVNCGWSATMTGPHSSWAEKGTATPAATHLGTREGIQDATRLARSTIPRVASTDRRNPTFAAMVGSRSNRIAAATQRKVRERPRKPPTKAARPTAPITAARMTLGSGPTMATNPIRPPAAIMAANGRDSRRDRASRMNPPSTRLQLAPLTAVRCVIPVVFMSVLRLSGKALVSPVTMPGNNPAASGGNHLVAALKECLSSLADCRISGWEASTTGPEDADKRAVWACPSRTSLRVPVVLTTWPACAFSQPSPPAISTSAAPRVTVPFAVTANNSAVTVHLFPPDWPGVVAGAGLPVIRISMTTPLWSATTCASGPVSRWTPIAAQWTATAVPKKQAKAKVAGIVRARTPARGRRRPQNSRHAPTIDKKPAAAHDQTASLKVPAYAAPHAVAAVGTSRRSVRLGDSVPGRASATLHRHKVL